MLIKNVEKEPEVGLFGGLPRAFPDVEPLLVGQAEETAGPCLLRERVFSLDTGVTAERGSADIMASAGRFSLETMADCG